MSESGWYKQGLRFTCTQCGNCCSGASGYVWLTDDERTRIAEFLGHDRPLLDGPLVRRVGARYSLTERENGDCVFLRTEGGKRICGIYPVRPMQCRTWPFWNWNLRSPEAWAAAAADCPGMNRGKLHNFVAVEEVRVLNKWEGRTPWSRSISAG